ncbi:SDR family NAD(P)-dependent oxidoreductase [uncultured Bacteroides sp.]|uniref:SDR family NAD(P)-dependent oxidoreductase n=1 Tax=uncultured Bacteroides sp. TaxID=162156 RepID=UPI002729C2A2|nr:3-oxoacyl-ACP reductase family protein [uncultured Bacteroides sp.]
MLEGKIAIITGGTRGIGFETARTFAKNGAKVIIFGSREATVNKAIDELKSDGLEIAGYWPNLNDYDDIQKTINQIVTDYGRIDILVNNAGISANQPIENTTPEDFNKIIDLNIRAMFYVTKAVVPTMKQQGNGVILNTSSMVSIYGQPSGVGYPTSKFAVNGMTKSLARELAPSGIRVNAVAPGVTNTDMIASLPEAQLAPIVKTIPLGRIGEPSDIANAFLFLASDLASYVTGEILQVDGGARS